MSVPLSYTVRTRTPSTAEDAVCASTTHCAERVPLSAVPSVADTFYAEVFVPVMGKITSLSVRLSKDGNAIAPTGNLAVTAVSPAVDGVGAYSFIFVEDIPIASVGPAMYRKTNIREAWYNSARTGKSGYVYLLLSGVSGLEEAVADVVMAVKPD